jgi:pimeloyl-ACP methyl ester carboxylesterase
MRRPFTLFVLALLLPVAAGKAKDHCKPRSMQEAAWQSRTACLSVPLDHDNGEKGPLDVYYELSIPDAPSMGVIIVFHGGPGFPRARLGKKGPMWRGLRAHFTMLYFHQRGAGYSGRIAKPEQLVGKRHLYSLDAMVKDTRMLHDKVLGSKPAVVMGKSAGGFLAMKYALDYPRLVSSLILACTSPDHRYISQREKVKTEFIYLIQQRHAGFLEAYARASDLTAEGLPAEALPEEEERSTERLDNVLFDLSYVLAGQFEMLAIIRDIAHRRWSLLRKRLARGKQTIKSTGLESIAILNSISCREFDYGKTNRFACIGIKTGPLYDIRGRLSEIKSPALVLSGKYDPILPPRFQKDITDGLGGTAEWYVLDMSAHMIFMEQEDATAQYVLDFLDVPHQQVGQRPAL